MSLNKLRAKRSSTPSALADERGTDPAGSSGDGQSALVEELRKQLQRCLEQLAVAEDGARVHVRELLQSQDLDASVQHKMDKLLSESTDLRKELRGLHLQCKQLEASNVDLEGTTRRMRVELMDLEWQRAGASDTKKPSQSKPRGSVDGGALKEVERLHAENAELQKQLEASKKKASTAKQTIRSLELQLSQRCSAELTSPDTDSSAWMLQKLRLEGRIDDLEAELDTGRRKAAKAQRTIADLEEQLREQSEAGDRPGADSAALKRQKLELEARVEDLEAELDVTKRKVAKAEQVARDLKQQREAEGGGRKPGADSAALKRQKLELEARVEDLEAELDEAKHAAAASAKATRDLEFKLEELELTAHTRAAVRSGSDALASSADASMHPSLQRELLEVRLLQQRTIRCPLLLPGGSTHDRRHDGSWRSTDFHGRLQLQAQILSRDRLVSDLRRRLQENAELVLRCPVADVAGVDRVLVQT